MKISTFSKEKDPLISFISGPHGWEQNDPHVHCNDGIYLTQLSENGGYHNNQTSSRTTVWLICVFLVVQVSVVFRISSLLVFMGFVDSMKKIA